MNKTYLNYLGGEKINQERSGLSQNILSMFPVIDPIYGTSIVNHDKNVGKPLRDGEP